MKKSEINNDCVVLFSRITLCCFADIVYMLYSDKIAFGGRGLVYNQLPKIEYLIS